MIIGNRDVTNPLEVIECIVAFDCKDYSARPRDRMLYAIVFGWDDEEYTRFGWDNETINEYKELHKRFEELSRIDDQPQVGGWIPVSDRLPKEYETVIGVTDLNYYCIAVYCKQHGFRSMDVGVESDIIAWQPLPEPLKEEKDV